MTMKLTSEEKKDLDRFTKCVVLKAAQLIVDSRKGQLTTTYSKTTSEGYSCNIVVPDILEVLTGVKKALKTESALIDEPLCVEISLRTLDGSELILETWSFGVKLNDNLFDDAPKAYYRMGNLLKSVVSLARVTPAYKTSRAQSSDSYIILYRIYVGQPEEEDHGKEHKVLRVGQLCLPGATLHLSLYYRTQVSIPPTKETPDSIMLKSDHYKSITDSQEEEKPINEDVDLKDEIKCGPFVKLKDNFEKELEEIHPPPFQHIFTKALDSTLEIENSTCDSTLIKEDVQNGNSPSESVSSNITMVSTSDDFIMVELKRLPFATESRNKDFGSFHKEWQFATPLQSFNNLKTFADQVPDYTKKLEIFEQDVSKYDKMMSTLCQQSNNN